MAVTKAIFLFCGLFSFFALRVIKNNTIVAQIIQPAGLVGASGAPVPQAPSVSTATTTLSRRTTTRDGIPSNIQSRLTAAHDNFNLGHFGVAVDCAGTAVEVPLKTVFNPKSASRKEEDAVRVAALFEQAHEAGYLTRQEMYRFKDWWRYRNDSTHWAEDPHGDEAAAMIAASETLVKKLYGLG